MRKSAEEAFAIMAKNGAIVVSDSVFGVTKWAQFVVAATHEGKIAYYRENIEDMLVQNYGWSESDARKASAELEKSCILIDAMKQVGG